MRSTTTILAFGALLCAAATICAQTPGTPPDSAGAPAPWLTRRDAEWVVAAAAATIAVAPFDRPISAEFGEPHWWSNAGVRRAADNVAFIGGSGPFVISTLAYAVGEGARMPRLGRAALHNVEAIALATAITGVAKGVAGRALPQVQARHEFSFGRGFHDGNGPFVSFPSGHTAAAFAMAAAMSGEVSRVSPAANGVFEPAAFTAAAAVGVARVIQRVHWPSDLPLAVLIGTWSGRSVEAHAYARGRSGALVRGLSVAPSPHGGVLMGWSSRASGTD